MAVTPTDAPADARRALESEVVTLFAETSRSLGAPRSLGEIYGLLFINPSPLTMEEIVGRLGISRGSASQGLRQLADLGAIDSVAPNGDRRHRYTARLELKRIIARLITERLTPRLANGRKVLRSLKTMAADLPAADRRPARDRLARLSRWHDRAAATLPLALQLLLDD